MTVTPFLFNARVGLYFAAGALIGIAVWVTRQNINEAITDALNEVWR